MSKLCGSLSRAPSRYPAKEWGVRDQTHTLETDACEFLRSAASCPHSHFLVAGLTLLQITEVTTCALNMLVC